MNRERQHPRVNPYESPEQPSGKPSRAEITWPHIPSLVCGAASLLLGLTASWFGNLLENDPWDTHFGQFFLASCGTILASTVGITLVAGIAFRDKRLGSALAEIGFCLLGPSLVVWWWRQLNG